MPGRDSGSAPAGRSLDAAIDLARIDALMAFGFPRLVEHETFDRAILRLALDQWLRRRAGRDLKEAAVQRRGRKRFVDEILAPLRGRLDRRRLRLLEHSLGMILGIEAFIALADIFDLGPQRIREVWGWACKALVAQALAEGEDEPTGR